MDSSSSVYPHLMIQGSATKSPSAATARSGGVTCPNSKCYFCAGTHLTFSCPIPHRCCTNDHCWVPLSHTNHGLVCPAQTNIDMTEVGQANCDYCEDLLDHETSVAASF